MTACPHLGVWTCRRMVMSTTNLVVTMKILAIVSQKGGSGKTTLAVHLATAAAAAGYNVAVIDLDPQATATKWGDRREADTPEVVSGQAVRLPALINTAQANGADLLVLDTAPNADQIASLAARAADLVLIPCRPAKFDLEAIETTLLLVQTARKPAYVVLNAVPPQGSIVEEATAGLVSSGAKVAPHQLTQRAAFTHAVIDGRTAQEFEPRGKAAREVDALYVWMCGLVDMPTSGNKGKVA